jgi:hypothetical protein
VRAAATLAATLLLGCAPVSLRGARVPPTAAGGWRTLKAEHRVSLDVRLANGSYDHRMLRGLIAVEQPDKLRLRAFGPGGIALFDVLVVGGRAKVIDALRAASGPLAEVLLAMAGDLQAAYQLAPAPPERHVETSPDAVVVSEPERTVRLSAYRALPGGVTFTRIDIRAARYTVGVDVAAVTLGAALDPRLFAE